MGWYGREIMCIRIYGNHILWQGTEIMCFGKGMVEYNYEYCLFCKRISKNFLAFRIIKKNQIISEYNTHFQNVYLIGQFQICMINYFEEKKTTSRG